MSFHQDSQGTRSVLGHFSRSGLLLHQVSQSALDSSGKRPPGSSPLFQPQTFCPQFPGPRGPRRGSPDHAMGRSLQPRPMSRAALGTLGGSSHRTAETPLFSPVSVQNKALLFSPSSAQRHQNSAKFCEGSQSRNQLSNAHSFLGTTFKRLGLFLL